MKAIYKYQAPILEKFDMDLPVGAKIIRFECIEGFISLWAIIDTEVPLEKRFFEMYKTGQEIETSIDDLVLIGMAKIFIGMELCLYTFENIRK